MPCAEARIRINSAGWNVRLSMLNPALGDLDFQVQELSATIPAFQSIGANLQSITKITTIILMIGKSRLAKPAAAVAAAQQAKDCVSKGN